MYNMSANRYKAARSRVGTEQRTYSGWDSTIEGVISILCGVAGGVLFIVLIMMVSTTMVDTVTGIINPQYGAIKEVMDMVKK